MSKKNRNKKYNPPPSDDTFDVRKNLRKLRQGKTSNNSSQTDSNFIDSQQNKISSIEYGDSYSGSYGLDFTESMYNRYDKLKDELNTGVSDLKDEISTQGQGIRDELNTKFHEISKEKLSISLFWKIISGLIAFVLILGGVIYTLSFKEFHKNIDNNTNSIENFDSKIDTVKNRIEKLNQD